MRNDVQIHHCEGGTTAAICLILVLVKLNDFSFKKDFKHAVQSLTQASPQFAVINQLSTIILRNIELVLFHQNTTRFH